MQRSRLRGVRPARLRCGALLVNRPWKRANGKVVALMNDESSCPVSNGAELRGGSWPRTPWDQTEDGVRSPTACDPIARPFIDDNRALRVLRRGDQVEILGTFFRVQAVGPKGLRFKLVKHPVVGPAGISTKRK